MNRYITLGALALMLAVAGTAYAQSSRYGTETMRSTARVSTSTPSTPKPSSNVDVACVGSAVGVREAAIGSALSTMQSAVAASYSTRASALAAAYQKTDIKEVRADVRAAWSAFKKSSKDARSAWNAAQRTAWNVFKTSTKSCKASRELGENTNASLEVAI